MESKSSQSASSSPISVTGPRLRPKATMVIIVLGTLLWTATPALYRQGDSFIAPDGYRTPFQLSDDYWQYDIVGRQWVDEERVLMLGDSVIWGEYVLPNESLPGQLNRDQEELTFANGGVNGLHPLAMLGIVNHFLPTLQNQPVVVHCNLIWMSSPDRDLTTKSEIPFNHESLVPQFSPTIPCYRATPSERLGNKVFQHTSLRPLVRHLRMLYLSGQDYQTWSLERARREREGIENPPIHAVSRIPVDKLRHPDISWEERGIPQQNYNWVPLEKSLQWWAFRETVMLLESRGCDVYVIIGPFNEHLLAAENRTDWEHMRHKVSEWLETHEIAYDAPTILSSKLYADASHPLEQGYQELSHEILRAPNFQDWLKRNSQQTR